MANVAYSEPSRTKMIVGAIINQPDLLDTDEAQRLEDFDFTEPLHRMVYFTVHNLYQEGHSKINGALIDQYLSVRPRMYEYFNSNEGYEFVNEAVEIGAPTSFKPNVERVKKLSLLRGLSGVGVDVSFIYDWQTEDLSAFQKQSDNVDRMSILELGSLISDRIDSIIDGAAGGSSVSTSIHGSDGFRSLIAGFKDAPEMGSPLYGGLINTITRGARLGKFYLGSAPTGGGKAIPNNTLIPTPQGMRLVGDVRQGDFVFGQDGKPTKVLQVHPQKEEKEIWEMTFTDGRKVKSCSEHLWEYRYDSHRTKEYRVEDIQALYNRALKLKNGLKNADGRGYRFHIRLNEPVQYEEKQFSVDPYIMGLALGDGSFRYDKTNKAFVFSSNDEEMVQSIAESLDCNFKKNSDHNFGYVFKPKNNPKKNLWVGEIFEQYPELWNLKSEDKFIPEVYMQGSIEQRLSLLQGLLDTDGSIDRKGRVSFTTASPQLRDQVILLVNSLGMTGTYGIDKREKYTMGECYDVNIQAKKEIKPKMFRVKRKQNIAIKYASSTEREEYKDHLAIVDIQPTKEKTEMTCFTVDNEDSLFLMNDYIVTHNTRLMVGDAVNFAVDTIYDKKKKQWIDNGIKEGSLFITTELDETEIQTLVAAFMTDINESLILDGRATEEQDERLDTAADILEDSPFWIEHIPDFSIGEIERIIRRHVRENDVKYVAFDYIHTSMKFLAEITKFSNGMKLREDQILFMLSSKLKDLASELGIFIQSATQLNGQWEEAEEVNQNLLRGI